MTPLEKERPTSCTNIDMLPAASFLRRIQHAPEEREERKDFEEKMEVAFGPIDARPLMYN